MSLWTVPVTSPIQIITHKNGFIMVIISDYDRFDCDFVGLKRSKETGKFCNICNGHLDCIRPKSCCQFTSQILCCDVRAALPCTEEVPCMVNFLGLNLAYKKKFIPGCCMKLEAMNKKFDAAPGAAPQLEMTR